MQHRSSTNAATLKSAKAELPRVGMPVDITDAERFPNIAEARSHYASLPAERKQQIEKEWNDG